MTTPSTPAVVVEQRHREAAADLVVPNGRWPGFPSDFRSGRADANELTQAFARFEQQHLQPLGQGGERLSTDKYGETAIDRIRDHAENGTMPPQFREDLRAILAILPRAGGWMPIESAPKDGTWIVVLIDNGDPYRVSWGRNREGNLQWCTVYGFIHDDRVTHWMPLPAAPHSTEEERA